MGRRARRKKGGRKERGVRGRRGRAEGKGEGKREGWGKEAGRGRVEFSWFLNLEHGFSTVTQSCISLV